MDLLDIFQRLGLAVAIGLLIGIERGWHERSEGEGERTAGLRTHTLLGLLGGIWGMLVAEGGPGGLIALAIAFLVVSTALAIFRLREVTKEGTFGATTLVAGMLAFALGAYAVMGNEIAAAASAVVVASFLALKNVLHSWLQRLTWPELRATLLLLAMSVILLPVLPDRGMGPLEAWNPRQLWLLTILLAAVSFAGYVAVKIAGDRRGIALTGIAGGLVSSTAVTMTLAKLARDHPVQSRLCLAGMAFSSGMMVIRVLTVVAVLNSTLLAYLGAPLVAGGVVLWLAGAFFLGRDPADNGARPALQLGNPFDIREVLLWGGAIAVITLLAKAASISLGAQGLLAGAAAVGIMDVDAITLSMTDLARGVLGAYWGAAAILVAVAANTVTKAIYAWIGGGRPIGVRYLIIAGLALVAGAGAILLVDAIARPLA
ncbi:MAG: DUF4010 domain-containing protein [Hyphomicrobiaceae bacterium]